MSPFSTNSLDRFAKRLSYQRFRTDGVSNVSRGA
jgi:hypothetical protein